MKTNITIDNQKYTDFIDNLAVKFHRKFCKNEPLDGDATEIVAHDFLTALNLLNGNEYNRKDLSK